VYMFDKSQSSVIDGTPPADATSASHAPALTAMTYAQLLHHGCEYLRSEGVGKQQVKNLASALRLWVKVHGFSMERPVAEEFSTEFDRYSLRFADLIAERLAARTQRDRQEQVIRWCRIVDALRLTDTLPEAFSEALAQALRASPLSRRQVARDCGIAVRQLEY